MKKTMAGRTLVVFLAAALFISLLAVAGCGGNSKKVKVMTFIGKSSASAEETQAMINKLEKEYKDKVIFEEVDYDDAANKDLLAKYHVTMNPTVIIFNTEGKIKQTFMGKPQEEMLAGAIESYIPSGSKRTSTTPSGSVPTQVQTLPMDSGTQSTIPGTTVVPNQ